MALFARARRALIGEPLEPDPRFVRLHPELAGVNLRHGGLPLRLGGWCLGVRSVAGIALGRTVWIARDVHLTRDLLLHELEHVRQWRTVRWFALRYMWESLRRGYTNNRFEVSAREAPRRKLELG